MNSFSPTLSPESDGPRLKLAIVDDDASVRRGLARLLRSSGHQVQVFSSGAEFLLRGLGEPLDCLIIDVRMPGQTGLTFADRMRAAGLKIPMILISGDIDASVVERVGRLGAVELLCKPLQESVILSAIARAVTKPSVEVEPRATRERV